MVLGGLALKSSQDILRRKLHRHCRRATAEQLLWGEMLALIFEMDAVYRRLDDEERKVFLERSHGEEAWKNTRARLRAEQEKRFRAPGAYKET